MANIIQCPQCGFLEYDEHSGCAVCGFQSHAALKTGHPAFKPKDLKFIEFPSRYREADLPLFDDPDAAKKTSVPAPALLWREELEEKLRQYRARRGGQKEERPDDAGVPVRDKKRSDPPPPHNFNEDLAAALDDTFKLPPLDAPSGQDRFESPLLPDAPTAATGSHRIPGFELPDSVQRIKQRQSHRRSELYQQPLLFEASTVAHGVLTDTEHPGLSIPVASVRERFLAGCVDLLVIAAVELISILPLAVLMYVKGWSLNPAPRSAMVCLFIFLIFALLYAFLFSATMRKTLGMHLRGLVLVNFAGESPSMKETTLRAMGYLVSAGSLLLGFIWVLFDVDALAWHDRISRTYPAQIHNAMPDR